MDKSKWAVGLLAILGGLFLLQSAGIIQMLPANYKNHLVEVTFLHTNDIHGHFMGSKATWLEHEPPVGGFGSLKEFSHQEQIAARRQARPLFVIDAGDWFTGAPESDLTDGAAMIAGLNQIDYDYLTIGNHEFDVGSDTLIQRIAELKHPVITSNVYLKTDTQPQQFPGTIPNAIVEKKGIKFGFFAVLTEDMKGYNIEGVKFDRVVPTARRQIRNLSDSGADIVVAITHIGLEEDRKLARMVDGIDVIVGAHSHSRLQKPEFEDNTIIVQAGSQLNQVGRLDLNVNSSRGMIVNYDGGLISLLHRFYPPDKEVQKVLNPYLEKVDKMLSEVVGYVTADLSRVPDGSSPLGNLVTDAMREATGADLAFQNSFGIRDNIPAGEVTMRHLYRVLPFGNELVVMDLTGQQIKKLLEQSASLEKGVLQLSGARIKVDYTKSRGNRVVEIKIDGENISPDSSYKVVTSSFLATGGDRYETFKEGENTETLEKKMREALEEYFRQQSPVEPPYQQRYRRAGEKKTAEVQ
jgi:2',3'-cyclic-nucleotide 2'-phosphodiesterase (5'-nucleotidase family)